MTRPITCVWRRALILVAVVALAACAGPRWVQAWGADEARARRDVLSVAPLGRSPASSKSAMEARGFECDEHWAAQWAERRETNGTVSYVPTGPHDFVMCRAAVSMGTFSMVSRVWTLAFMHTNGRITDLRINMELDGP